MLSLESTAIPPGALKGPKKEGFNDIKGLPVLRNAETLLDPLKATRILPCESVVTAPEPEMRVAVAASPVPPLTDEIGLVVLTNTPAVVTVTGTVNEHTVVTIAPLIVIKFGGVRVTVPPHTGALALGTVSPAGSISVNATPVEGLAPLAAGFVIVNVKLLIPFTDTTEGINALVNSGGASTNRLAVDASPVPPSREVTAPVVFILFPEVVPVTFTEKVHGVPTNTNPCDKLMVLDPAFAVICAIPPQVKAYMRLLGLETTNPAGRVSVNATLDKKPEAFGFVTVNVREVDPFSEIVAAPKTFDICGGDTTVRVATAVFPVPSSVELTCVLLFLTPAVVPCTLREKLHDEFPARTAPDKLTTPVPAAAVTVAPPQVVGDNPLGVEITTPDGRLSVNVTPCTVLAVEF